MLVLLIVVLPGSFFGVVYADHQTRKSLLSASKLISDDHPKGEVELINTKGELGQAETETDQNVPDFSTTERERAQRLTAIC